MNQTGKTGVWTGPREAQLRRLCGEGQSWAAIGAALGVPAELARERARRLGAVRPPAASPPPREPAARPPLPPGHPRAWALLTAGTLLDGTAWPGWA